MQNCGNAMLALRRHARAPVRLSLAGSLMSLAMDGVIASSASASELSALQGENVAGSRISSTLVAKWTLRQLSSRLDKR